MEKRENEDPHATAENAAAVPAQMQGDTENDNPADEADSTSGDNSASAPDSGSDSGDTTVEPGQSTADPGGEQGENGGESGDGEDTGDGNDIDDKKHGEEDPDKKDDPASEGKSKFEERFLTSPDGQAIDPAVEKERLAVSLLKMALTLLTEKIPDDSFIPLMNATLAYEAIQAARAEGEIAGRNAIIEEQLLAPPAGAPDLNGTPIARTRRAAASIFDLADLAR